MNPSDRALVTGGAGFIGSNITRALLARGQRVRVFDDFSTGRAENLADIADDIEVIEADLRDADRVAAAMQDVAVVFHQGAIPSVFRSVGRPLPSHDVNATGTLNVLIGARAAGVERVVYASSSSVYGNAERQPVEESMPARPISPYGVSKLAGEHYLHAFHETYGFPTVALRYFNVFGPLQNPQGEYAAVVPRFVTSALAGEAATIFGDGQQSRDFTFVGDVVRGNLLAADAPETALGGVFNLAPGGTFTVNDLLASAQEAVRAATGREPVEPDHVEPRPGEIRASQADITRAREVLGFEPRFTLDEGLGHTVAWIADGTPWTPPAE